MRVGERVFELLDRYNLQQKALADYIKVSKATVNGWQRPNRNPSVDLIVPIAKFFSVSTDYLLTGEESNNKVLSIEDKEWLDIIAGIPLEKRDMCKDFLKTHMAIPDKFLDKKSV